MRVSSRIATVQNYNAVCRRWGRIPMRSCAKWVTRIRRSKRCAPAEQSESGPGSRRTYPVEDRKEPEWIAIENRELVRLAEKIEPGDHRHQVVARPTGLGPHRCARPRHLGAKAGLRHS